VIESFVDLTYRGLSLGRGIKLTQVRPSSGYLELAIPMPVGTHLAIATEEGVTFDATVSWVNEQVAGTDRAPGMVVVPAIVADPASSWWKARIALPDEDQPKSRSPRNRPVTVRPRSQTEPGPPPEEAITEEIPTIIADLNARVAAARTASSEQPAPVGDDPGDQGTTAMPSLDQESLVRATQRSDSESAMQTGEHTVIIDDDHTSKLVAPPDPSMQGIDPGAPGASVGAGVDGDLGVNDATEVGEAPEAPESTEVGEVPEASEAPGGGEVGSAGDGGPPRGGRGPGKRRKRR
jgi:hypothetical protein